MDRLSLATLRRVPTGARPAVDPAALRIGIAHLGIGAFHRAHQAVYTEAAMAATADNSWGICGVTQRSAAVAHDLLPQDCLYAVLRRQESGSTARVVGSVRDVVCAREQPGDVLALLARPQTRIVTVTVTEKGYRHDPVTRRLRRDDQETVADALGRAPATVVGQLVRGLQRRMAADAGPVTVVCCDNLPANGSAVRGLVLDFCELLPGRDGEPLVQWIEDNVAFPATMVDRIVPATTDADRAEVATLIGLADAAAVVSEPFGQWVIEDRFAAPRPAWERAGALLTSDVVPYETMKLRLLNGSHSALAYLGALSGCTYLSEVMQVDHFQRYVRGLMDVDLTPDLVVPDGFDLQSYRAQLVDRFANPGLCHRTTQVAADGSQKLPLRLLEPIRARLRAGAAPWHACLAVAAWIRYVTAAESYDGQPLPVDDPLADRFRVIAAAGGGPGEIVGRMLALPGVFGPDLGDDDVFRGMVTEALTALTTAGPDEVVASLPDNSR